LTYRLIYEKRFLEDLESIPVKDRHKVKQRLEWLAENVRQVRHIPLKETRFEGVYRLRLANLRIFYLLEHKSSTIYVLSIKDRREAYRRG